MSTTDSYICHIFKALCFSRKHIFDLGYLCMSYVSETDYTGVLETSF